MDSYIYFSLSSAYFVLFVLGCLVAKRFGWIDVANVLLLVIVALFYDNAVQAVGKYIGESAFLQTLNFFRYVFHAFITPLLILFAWRALTNTDLKWTKRPIVMWSSIILTISSIGLELAVGVWGITLEPVWKNGVLRYEHVGQTGLSSIMIIVVMVALLFSALIVWWKQRWAVYFLGVLFMGSTPLLNSVLKTDAAHNIAEFLLVSALLATQYYQQRRKHLFPQPS